MAKMAELHAQRHDELRYARHKLQWALMLWHKFHSAQTRQLVREAICQVRIARYRTRHI